MVYFPIFLSVVVVIRNRSTVLEAITSEIIDCVSPIVSDYELIVIDNASDDDSVAKLKILTQEDGLPNLQIYTLTKEVDKDTAFWVGLENALGDFVAVIDPEAEDISFLPAMLEKAVSGADIVFATNQQKLNQNLVYQCAYIVFKFLYKWFNDANLSEETPQYRILNKRVVTFLMQYSQPAITYRHLQSVRGFIRSNLRYTSSPKTKVRKSLIESIDRGMRLLVSTTRLPMRLVTALSLFGAAANLLYTLYVLVVGFIKADVAPGWISLSLQQSGMFFLISLVLLILGEYILQMATLSNEGPAYHVSQEFTSVNLTRNKKLNVEEVVLPATQRAALIYDQIKK